VVDAESDHHPLELQWQDPDYDWVKPQNYFVWFCPSCYYADIEEAFRKGSDDLGAGACRQWLQEARGDPMSLPARLGPMVNLGAEAIGNHQALNVHLLAACILESIPQRQRDNEKLGCLYLRISWLYREAQPLDPRYVLVHALLQSMAVSWPGIPLTDRQAVTGAIECFRTIYDSKRDKSGSQKELAMLLLLGRLYERVGDLDAAADYCRVIFELAMATRAQGQKSDSDAAEKKLAGDKIAKKLDGLQDFRADVEIKVLDRDRQHIDEVTARAGQLSVDQMVEELRKRGCHTLTLQKLRSMFTAASGHGTLEEGDDVLHKGLWDRVLSVFKS
jgi:hypothetical protein